MKANSDVPYEGTAFEAIILPDIEKKEGAFIISFRSLINGKLLSAKHERLYANAESLSNTEKFYVYYSSNNVIGLSLENLINLCELSALLSLISCIKKISKNKDFLESLILNI